MTSWKKGHSAQSVRPVSAHTHNPLTAGQSTSPSRTPVPNVAIPARSRPTGDVPLRTFFPSWVFFLIACCNWSPCGPAGLQVHPQGHTKQFGALLSIYSGQAWLPFPLPPHPAAPKHLALRTCTSGHSPRGHSPVWLEDSYLNPRG